MCRFSNGICHLSSFCLHEQLVSIENSCSCIFCCRISDFFFIWNDCGGSVLLLFYEVATELRVGGISRFRCKGSRWLCLCCWSCLSFEIKWRETSCEAPKTKLAASFLYVWEPLRQFVAFLDAERSWFILFFLTWLFLFFQSMGSHAISRNK